MINETTGTAQSETAHTKLPWVEPTVELLDVRETSAMPTVGGDGNVVSVGGHSYYDCTRS